VKIKQYISKLLYKSEQKGNVKNKTKEAAGISSGTMNCTGFFARLLQNKSNVTDYSTLFVLTCYSLTDMVRVFEGKII